jgi:hypothetical protein
VSDTLTKIQTSDVPEHVAKLTQDYELFDIYLRAVEKFGSNDIVVAVDPSDLDDVYAGPREDILAALREDEKDNLLAAPMLEALKMPASFATGVARSYWLLVKESDGFHCTAVGSVSRTKFSKRT